MTRPVCPVCGGYLTVDSVRWRASCQMCAATFTGQRLSDPATRPYKAPPPPRSAFKKTGEMRPRRGVGWGHIRV